MTKLEYSFLTSNWQGEKNKTYNQVFAFCRSFGWCAGFDENGRVVLTKKGINALKAYQAEENYKKIDVI